MVLALAVALIGAEPSDITQNLPRPAPEAVLSLSTTPGRSSSFVIAEPSSGTPTLVPSTVSSERIAKEAGVENMNGSGVEEVDGSSVSNSGHGKRRQYIPTRGIPLLSPVVAGPGYGE